MADKNAPQPEAASQPEPAPAPQNDAAKVEGGPADGADVATFAGNDGPDKVRIIDGDRYANYSKSGDGYKFDGFEEVV